MNRILITGATGFIGSRLALHAHSRGFRVTATGPVRNPAEDTMRRELLASGIEVVDVSIDNTDRLRLLMKDQDVVVHLAAAQHEARQPESHFQTINAQGTNTLLQLAQQAGIRRFVYASTIGVYGDAGTRELSESDAVAPANAYTRSKVAAEALVRSAPHPLEVVIARISETYGPGDLRLLKLFRAVGKGTYRTIGDGENVRQPIFVEDLCRGLMELALSPNAAGETFILAGTERSTTDQFISTIARAVGREPFRMHLPVWPFRLAAAACEALGAALGFSPPLHRRRLDFFLRNFRFSTAKAERLVGFRSEIPLEDGIRRTADWYRSKGLLADPLGHAASDSPSAPRDRNEFAVQGLRGAAPDALRVLVCATGAGLLILLLYRMQTRIGPLAMRMFVKEGPFELVTFLLEMASAAWCLSAVYLMRSMKRTLLPWLYACLGALLFLVAMEEINWGQTLMGFKTPEGWAAINYQQETSLHNLVDRPLLTQASNVIAIAFGLAVVLFAAIRARAPLSLPGMIAPHPALVPLACCVVYAALRQHPEVVELLLSIFFAFYTYRIRLVARHMHSSRLHQTGPSVTPLAREILPAAGAQPPP